MPRSKRHFFYLGKESEFDEALVNYCQNPPFPYRKTVELVRAAIESFFLPFALYQSQAEPGIVLKVAESAIACLENQVRQIRTEIIAPLKDSEPVEARQPAVDNGMNIGHNEQPSTGGRARADSELSTVGSPNLLGAEPDKIEPGMVADDPYRAMGYD